MHPLANTLSNSKSYILQLKTKSQVNKEILYWVNTRELNRVLSIRCLPYIHWADSLYYTKPSLL